MIGVIGISYKSAPVNIRQKFSFNESDILNFMDSLEGKLENGNFVILSTCNRTEVYFFMVKSCRCVNYNSVLRRFVKFWNVKESEKKYFYSYSDTKAVKHLFRVASGLEAMALGEDQVFNQVKDAYRLATEREFTGPVLNRLFQKAFEVGKCVRTETAISKGALSISYAGVELAARIFEDLTDRSVLLIGAGETGELVLDNLSKKGCTNVFIANRTHEKAVEIAEKYKGQAVMFKDLMEAIMKCDIIITSTGAKSHLVDYQRVQQIMEHRNGKPIFFIDLSVPRNVEENVKKIENVYLYDIDSLEEVIAHNYDQRSKEIVKAIQYIETATDEFFNWLSQQNITPTIECFKNKFESLNTDELAALKNKLTPEEFDKVTLYGNYLTKKYTSMVIKNLIKLSRNGRNLDYVNLVKELFELEKEN